jgi:hypothetical protein
VHQLKGKPLKLKNFMMNYKQLVTKSIKITILYWPKILMQELVLSQLISTLDMREKKTSITMEDTYQKSASLINLILQTLSSDIRIYTSSHGKHRAPNL